MTLCLFVVLLPLSNREKRNMRRRDIKHRKHRGAAIPLSTLTTTSYDILE